MAQPVILFHFMLHNSIRTFGGGRGFQNRRDIDLYFVILDICQFQGILVMKLNNLSLV